MPDRAVLEQERDQLRREIGGLEQQIKGVREYIGAQERLLRNAPESTRPITERSLAEARSDLSVKELKLQQLRQELQSNQQILGKIEELARKQQDVQTLERELRRIQELYERARQDLDQLQIQVMGLSQAVTLPESALVFNDGQRLTLRADKPELLIGCVDQGVFPDVDLTPFGGTGSGASRRHALLRYANGFWSIVDLNSTNGTFVNGSRIASNTPTPLQDQTRVRFGGIDSVFAMPGLPANKTTRLS